MGVGDGWGESWAVVNGRIGMVDGCWSIAARGVGHGDGVGPAGDVFACEQAAGGGVA